MVVPMHAGWADKGVPHSAVKDGSFIEDRSLHASGVGGPLLFYSSGFDLPADESINQYSPEGKKRVSNSVCGVGWGAKVSPCCHNEEKEHFS